MTHSATHFMPP